MSVRWVFSQLSPAGENARLSVFIFHRVLPATDPLFPGELDVARFEQQVGWIGNWFNVLPLAQAVERLREGGLPVRAAAITFDDGYADNCTVALPILRRAGVAATFFIATGYLDGGSMWNDKVIEAVRGAEGAGLDLTSAGLGCHAISTIEERRAAIRSLIGKLKYLEQDSREELADRVAAVAKVDLPRDLMLTTDQVRTLSGSGMTIGAHTVSHPILSRVPEEKARDEMIQSKKKLESIVEQEVTLFAYPNGKPDVDYAAAHVRLARDAGFLAAVSTGWGAANKQSDIFQIPRFTPWDTSKWRYAVRLARNMRHAVTVVH
jgi:peptidoglycan/xylan/chitin deacetylase (PgdA/CDA1 family)